MNVQDLIAKHEGSRAMPYNDTMGIPTIGIGHNLQANPLPAGWNPPLSQDQITELFNTDLAKATNQISNALPWFAGLDEVRQAVLVDMTFNMGWGKLAKFVNTLGMVEKGDYAGAASGMLDSAWAKEVPNRANEDAKMMSTGLWPDDPNFNA